MSISGRSPLSPARRRFLGHAGAGAACLLAAPLIPRRAHAQEMRIAPVATGLTEPWALAFLPDGGFLVSERGGRLLRLGAGAGAVAIGGVPRVATGGQGGLLDIMLPRDFAETGQAFLTYAAPQEGGGAGTALGVGGLDGDRLADFAVLFEAAPGGRGGRHFGGRVVELPDGTLALTSGDRGVDERAQDLSRHEGKVLRIARDGGVPADNPFRDTEGARPEIFSYGHRNPQGAALDADGRLWVSEHGARGGDEINPIRPGANYGWPVISYGTHYSGARIGIGTEAGGMEQPAHYWDPSIAPSGHVICSGRMFPDWRGHHLVGSLNADHIARHDPASPGPGGWAGARIATAETRRVRDIREAPDGALWFLSVGNGAVFRLARPGA
ncbi:MAG: PQQ-dependent sugar dehydrogenase [Gemmobacter sp.]